MSWECFTMTRMFDKDWEALKKYSNVLLVGKLHLLRKHRILTTSERLDSLRLRKGAQPVVEFHPRSRQEIHESIHSSWCFPEESHHDPQVTQSCDAAH
mmetsp:Transcript_106146/g.193520  ORF Transcript_106146/g.193520 Transcript_106146/m.193520 type:complete len:98 (-) Transcript_106146:128-421(-)